MPPDDAGAGTPRATGSTRARPTLLLAAAALLLIARVTVALYEQRHPPAVRDRVAWQPIEGAEARALTAHRPVLYDFTAEWCEPCRTMQREVFADPQAAAEIERAFIPVRVLDRTREEGRNLAIVEIH